MHEPITIAKLRKATKITVPAGGYIVLVGPDKSFTEHAGARAKLAEKTTHEDIAQVICGRIDNKYRNLVFPTAAETKEKQQAAVEAAQAVDLAIKESDELQKKREADDREKAAKAHKKTLAEINAVNDSIANREFPGATHTEIPVAAEATAEVPPTFLKEKAAAVLKKLTTEFLNNLLTGLAKGNSIKNPADGFEIQPRQQIPQFAEGTPNEVIVQAILDNCDFIEAKPI